MYKKPLLLLYLLLFSFALKGQSNLVPNHSFEVYKVCPNNYNNIRAWRELIPYWYSPVKKGTPDYFNACSRIAVGVPGNIMGYLDPYDSLAYIGLALTEKPDRIKQSKRAFNYREYIQVRLTEPLLANNRYMVSMHYAIATYSTFAINSLGLYLSKKKIKKRNGILPYTPQVMLDTSQIVNQVDIWHELSDTITARGGEKFVTIGNFLPDKLLRYDELDVSQFRESLREIIQTNKYAYYYIDVVVVKEVLKNNPY